MDQSVYAAAVGLAKSAIALCGKLLKWGNHRYQSAAWKKRLESVQRDLLLERPNVTAAQEAVRLAEESGYKGPELETVRTRLALVRAGRKYKRKTAAKKKTPAKRAARKTS